MTRLIDADRLKVQIPTIEDEYKYVHKLIDSAPAVPQVTVFAETADEQAIADLKAELQSVLDAKPQGDLISREALKSELNRLGWTEENGYKNRYVLDDIIDNTPTVDAVVNTIEVRPEGEWVEKEETRASVSYHCSNCKVEGIPITPFCPWCGARMKDIDMESENE